MSIEFFHPVVAGWFRHRFCEPTEAQRLSWPRILEGQHTLVAAPTGSGKTLAAFLVCIDRLLRQSLQGTLPDQTRVLYVSPLKALSNDIRRNLEIPLQEIRALAAARGFELNPIRVTVRTGDTPAAQRQAMLRKPPHILVTTPESLYLLLTGSKSRQMLRCVDTVIVDEIHALARDKRGSHLALSLARLDRLCTQPQGAQGPPVRIGLSATQRPIDAIARFLVGTANAGGPGLHPVERSGETPVSPGCSVPHVNIVDTGHIRQLDLAVEVPPSELSAVCSVETWQEVYGRLSELIRSHRSTLVFVNTRRMAERVCHHLEKELGEGLVASHHGSLSREIRLHAEERLKAGSLKAIVATASLELGIDIGFIDLVCQIGSPRSIATFLQRVGRSGHALGLVPKGRLFSLTRDELLEALALIRAVQQGKLDRVQIPEAPLDILAQQIVAAVACEEWDEDELFAMCRRAWPYRNLKCDDFDAILEMLGEGITPSNRAGAYLHRDRIHHKLRARRGAQLAAITSGGAIPETADYRVVTEGERTFVGTVNEDFAIESLTGDVFLLGNSSWRIRHVRGGEVTVVDAQGAPATIPFWLGEAPGRTAELSAELSDFREQIGQRAGESPESAALWLQQQCGADAWAARQVAGYVAAQHAALGLIPTQRSVVFERFFDESGGMQLVIHAPFGSRINRAWGLALRKCFCRTFDFELQASADDNGILLSIGPQHSFPLDRLFSLLNPRNGESLLVQALLAVPMFLVRWRWNTTRALAVLRQRAGKKVPPALQRFRADDLLTAVFPMQTACFEHRTGDLEVPDHPLVRQTVYDCLHEAMDLPGWLSVLEDIQAKRIELIARDTREPSPFSYEILNANPYAFLDDAPLEERRARAVATRRTVRAEDMRDLGRLDPGAIAQVRSQARPTVRDAEELHDTLLTCGALPLSEGAEWHGFFLELVEQGRATECRCENRPTLWVAAERWPTVRAAFPGAEPSPPISLPTALQRTVDEQEARQFLVRSRLALCGPTTVEQIADDLGMVPDDVLAALEQLESEGVVLRGRFTQAHRQETGAEWCERRLLARIHRLTLDGLRRQVEPVKPDEFLRFLTVYHHLQGDVRPEGRGGLNRIIAQLQGFELPAGSWEREILPARLVSYESAWLDELFHSGAVAWGRLQPARDSNGGHMLTRTAPISLMQRADLAWLLPPDRSAPLDKARGNAQAAFEALRDHGALFFEDLLAVTGLLAAHLEDALGELAALGLVTADGFGAIRGLLAKRRLLARRSSVRDGGIDVDRLRLRPRSTRRSRSLAYSQGGRWSRFPPFVQLTQPEHRVEQWAWQLLTRYGVMFRDLLARESVAPAWHELVPVYRRLEARGEIRGGRFVAGVAGEQFALTDAIDQLRRVRTQPPVGEHASIGLIVSAADPLNLVGILTPGSRVPATAGNRILFVDGSPVAARQSREIRWLRDVDDATRRQATLLLERLGGPLPQPLITELPATA